MKLKKSIRVSVFPLEVAGGFSRLWLLIVCAGLVVATAAGYLASHHKLRVPEVLKPYMGGVGVIG